MATLLDAIFKVLARNGRKPLAPPRQRAAPPYALRGLSFVGSAPVPKTLRNANPQQATAATADAADMALSPREGGEPDPPGHCRCGTSTGRI
ncbi:MAG: hypothetical protein AcusKO_23270 [Acuticoccus sp.]